MHVSCPHSSELPHKILRKSLEPFLRKIVNQPITGVIIWGVTWALGASPKAPLDTLDRQDRLRSTSDRYRYNIGSMSVRRRINVRSTSDQQRIDIGLTLDRQWIGIGSTWDRLVMRLTESTGFSTVGNGGWGGSPPQAFYRVDYRLITLQMY